MPLVEGIGDEVVQFAGVVVTLSVIALAWWSTNARTGRYRIVHNGHSARYRTAMMMRSRDQRPVSMIIRTTVRTSEVTDEPVNEGARVIPLQEMDSIEDAHMAMINHHRLHFYRRVESPTITTSMGDSTGDESETQDDPEPASNAQIREMDSIVSAMEADGAGEPFNRTTESSNLDTTKSEDIQVSEEQTSNENNSEDSSASPETSEETTPDQPSQSRILIKLKYLNDTLKEVEGSLDELLKDFKCRHFSSELSSSCRVRLIFAGRVLEEAATLRACGLHAGAVVHCLVHAQRPPQQRPTAEGPTAPAERSWDLENILMTLVSIALTVVWLLRCEYSNMFTASASVALFGLTVFYSVTIFVLYLSDTFQVDRRPPQPVPSN